MKNASRNFGNVSHAFRTHCAVSRESSNSNSLFGLSSSRKRISCERTPSAAELAPVPVPRSSQSNGDGSSSPTSEYKVAGSGEAEQRSKGREVEEQTTKTQLPSKVGRVNVGKTKARLRRVLSGEESNKGEACRPGRTVVVGPFSGTEFVASLRVTLAQQLADSVAARLNLGNGLFARLGYFPGHFITWNTAAAR
ncbi:hypothetical protein K0M31_015871 [Melipona bicolor]|uniref:Uncharacterized protein n=1 Tax=Melipona bicolor TaxID=60889 RepID=A0AA40KT65_9HYME|nr:hypothetical protein K0M31_015871 [Melipona bicolor]